MTELPAFVHRVADLERELPPIVARFGAAPVVVTDAGIAAAGVVDPVLSCLDAPVVVVPPGEPQTPAVAGLARELRSCDVAVAVGGGSVLDTAKLAARLVEDPDGLESRLLGGDRFPEGRAVVALPTTAGSGAEVTRTAIVSHHGRKSWAWDDRLRPDAAVLAPILTAATPPLVALAAGLDAFVHAVEAGTGQRSTPEVAEMAFAAAAVMVEHLAPALSGNADSRSLTMAAATVSGLAIDECGTGLGHAVGHALGSVGSIPHGLAVMLGLRRGLEWTLDGAGHRFAGLAAVLGTGVDGLTRALDTWLKDVGFDVALRRWDPPKPQQLATEMLSPDHLPMRMNGARPINDDDVEFIAEVTVTGWGK